MPNPKAKMLNVNTRYLNIWSLFQNVIFCDFQCVALKKHLEKWMCIEIYKLLLRNTISNVVNHNYWMAQYYLNMKNKSILVHIPKFHIVKECLPYLQTMLLVPLRLQMFNPNIKKTFSFTNHDWKVLWIECLEFWITFNLIRRRINMTYNGAIFSRACAWKKNL